MHHEGFPTAAHEQTDPDQAMHESIHHPDGSLNESFLSNNFGIGLEEASQIVTFGGRTGTVAQMLGEEGCPVGGMIRSAYLENGLDGVVGKLGLLQMMDSGFKVEISTATREREDVKKKTP